MTLPLSCEKRVQATSLFIKLQYVKTFSFGKCIMYVDTAYINEKRKNAVP